MRSSTNSVPRSFARPLLWFFVIATIAKVWLGPVQTVQVANAQIPDSGAQLNQVILEVRATNKLLAQIKNTLEAGTIKVRIEGADKPKGKAKGRRGR